MKKKLTILMVAMAFAAPLALADGVLNDAPKTKEIGGVGNYTTETMRDDTADNTTTGAQTNADTTTRRAEPVAATESDTVDLGASSSGRAH